MRLLLLGLALVPLAAIAQDDTASPPPPGVGVETVGLRPGEAKTFVLRPGKSHQLLVPAAVDDKGAITVSYADKGGHSVLTASSGNGAMTFSILADPKGDGGYVRAGSMSIPGDGSAATQDFNRNLGAIVVGDFKPAG